MLPTTPSPQPTTNASDTVIVSSGGNNKSHKKLLIAGGGVVLLLFGLISALVLSTQIQQFSSSAWDCQNYAFAMSSTGVVSVNNGSTRNEPLQRADVFINTAKVATYDVPALAPGESATLGTVTLPGGGFDWEIRGTADCEDAGRIDMFSARCLNVLVYDGSWTKVTDLTQLKAGDVVRLTVAGSTNSGQFTKARFTVNGALEAETTLTRPASSDFYMEYTLPEDVSSFSFEGELFHDTANIWI